MHIYFWPRRRLRQALVGAGLAVVAFFSWFLGGYTVKPVSGETPQAISRGNPARRAVALMFNVDWGEEYLPQILQLLAQHEAKATFFITGRWAEKFPHLVREIAAAGHEVGNHGYAHPHVARLEQRQIKEDLERGEAVLRSLLGSGTRYYAPPYGEATPLVVETAAALGYQTVLWTIDSVDWQPGREPAAVMAGVREGLVAGALILLHPTALTVEVLPSLLTYLAEQHYRPLTLSEVLAP